MVEEWMTIEEAAAYLKMAIPTIRKYLTAGKLPSYKQGRLIRLKRAELDAFLEAGRRDGPVSKG